MKNYHLYIHISLIFEIEMTELMFPDSIHAKTCEKCRNAHVKGLGLFFNKYKEGQFYDLKKKF